MQQRSQITITSNLYLSLNFDLNIMSQPKLSSWIKLAEIPKGHACKILFNLKSKSLIVMACSLANKGQMVLYKYLFSVNNWKKYEIQRPKKLHPRKVQLLAMNEDKIYTFTNKHEIAMLELIHETKKCKFKIIKIINESYKLDKSAVAIFVEDAIHYIAKKHLKYNTDTEKLSIMPHPTICHDNQHLIRIKNKLLLFAECCSEDSQDPELIIQEYDIKNNSWQHHSIKLQEKFMIVSCTSILNKQMVLLCGSENWQDEHKYILIYEVKTKSIKKSNVKFPVPGRNYLYSISDKKMDNLSTNAWIKNECRNLNVCLPECLSRMMTSFFIEESVHVINQLGTHYKTDVFKIINNCSNN